MTTPPVSQETASALAAYCFGGSGPSHSKLTTTFLAGGYADVAPPPVDGAQGPNKESRVQTTVLAAIRKPAGARKLVDGLLLQLRLNGQFESDRAGYDPLKFRTLSKAFARSGWALSGDGLISPISGIDLSTGGRDALDEQITRIAVAQMTPDSSLARRRTYSKQQTSRVEEFSAPVNKGADFGHLWHLARERLGILPAQVDVNLPGADSIRATLQSSWTIAEQVNTLRGKQGTGHGRTLPTGVSPELAQLVVREACSVAEYVLTTLDRQVGRS